MTKDISEKTLHANKLEQGFSIRACIQEEDLLDELTKINLEQRDGRFSDIHVVSDEEAFKGSIYRLENPSIIVYVKYNKDHSSYLPCTEKSYTPAVFICPGITNFAEFRSLENLRP